MVPNGTRLSILLSVSVAAGAAVALLLREQRQTAKQQQQQTGKVQLQNDAYYLRICQDLRERLSPPRHSGFRVVCLLLLDDGSVVTGANDEHAISIGGSICAERGALLTFRARYGKSGISRSTPKIHTIYIVSDHPDVALPPGCLCREYMYGHAAIDPNLTRIVLQSCDRLSVPHKGLTLTQLYPYASLTARCVDTRDCITTSQSLVLQLEKWWKDAMSKQDHQLPLSSLSTNEQTTWKTVKQLVEHAQRETECIETSKVFPIKYGAAAAVQVIRTASNSSSSAAAASTAEETRYIVAHQLAAQEYGCTQDAVCRLLAVVHHLVADSEANGSKVVIQCLVQVDQWGIPHAPFAAARSSLVEFGYRTVPVIVAVKDDSNNVALKAVEASELVPFIPELPERGE